MNIGLTKLMVSFRYTLYTITTETNLKDYPGTKFVVTVSQRVKGTCFL
jgi:predicted branched-subunit amino acid permease